MTNKMVRNTTSKAFVDYPLERGGYAVFNQATGYQVATFHAQGDARRACIVLNTASFTNALAPA